jgi:hypothetical protein
MESRVRDVVAAVDSLIQAGPTRGYFPSPEKSIVLVRPADQAAAESHLEGFQFEYQAGPQYLGSILGAKISRDAWLAAKIDTWIAAIRTLAKIAKRYAQTSYVGMARSLQMECSHKWKASATVIENRDTSLPNAEAKKRFPQRNGLSTSPNNNMFNPRATRQRLRAEARLRQRKKRSLDGQDYIVHLHKQEWT